MRPTTAADGHDAPRLVDQLVPSLAAVIDDVVVGGEDPVRQPVVAHELLDVLDRVELGALGWQRDDADVAGDLELAGGVPSGLIHQHNRVSAGRNGKRYLGQVQGHGLGVAEGQNQPSALAMFRADRAEYIGRFCPLILRRRGSAPTPRPAPRDLVLLANAGFSLEPDLYRRALRERGSDLCQLGSKAPFLNASIACSFWA